MFQSIRKESSQTIIQPQLEIGQENDVHEKEANHVADKVMSMGGGGCDSVTSGRVGTIHKMHAGPVLVPKMGSEDEEEKIQKMSSGAAFMPKIMVDEEEKTLQKMPEIIRMTNGFSGGMMASENVEQGINNSKGGGQLLSSDIQNELGNKMNADLSGVKVHTDENAVQMNKEIGAKAFTHGNGVYFNKGQYNPTSSQGKHLLAHELTHTVQQGNGIKPKIQRKVVPTDFGEFETKKLVALPSNSGVEIILKFSPDVTKVDAKKIAITQVINPFSATGQNYPFDPNQANRIVPDDKPGAGYFLDEMGSTNNPIYSYTKNLSAEQKLKDTPKSSNPTSNTTKVASPTDGGNSNYELGKCYKTSPNNTSKTKHPATIWDTPKGGGKVGEGMTFETTAFAIEGVDKNKYYGSVKWGYKIEGTEAAPTVTITDIDIASMGMPTQNFIEAAILWNKGTMTGSYEVSADPASAIAIATSTLATIPKNTKVKQIGNSVALSGAPFTNALKVETQDNAGAATGFFYYISTSDVMDKGNGSDNKKLPLDVTTAAMCLSRVSPLTNIDIPIGTVVQFLDPLEPAESPTRKLKILSGTDANAAGTVTKEDAGNVKNEGDT